MVPHRHARPWRLSAQGQRGIRPGPSAEVVSWCFRHALAERDNLGRVSRSTPAAIGARIRTRRQELGLSQRELSEPGVSFAYVSRIEAGKRDPSVKALRKLAPKLGVSVHWLETGAASPAERLASLVLEHEGHALPTEAVELARRIIADDQ
jgi:transcriptional regulator with XRE-family HTH domain